MASKLQTQSDPPSSISRFERTRGWGVDDFWEARVYLGAQVGLWRGMRLGTFFCGKRGTTGGSALLRVVSGAITLSAQQSSSLAEHTVGGGKVEGECAARDCCEDWEHDEE